MKKLIQTTTLLLTIITLFSCCKKEDPEPCEGCYTEVFRCKIDGVDFEPYCKSGPLFGCSAIDCQYYKGSGDMSLRVYNDQSNLNVQLNGRPIKIGQNTLRPRKGAFQDWSIPTNCGLYNLDTTKDNRLIILEIDTINQIIKGEFDFYAIDVYNGCDSATVHITDGYFDVVYRF